MTDAYQCRLPYHADHPHALAVYCSDGRFTDAVEDLLRSLGHPALDTMTLPGGPGLFEFTSASLGTVEVVRAAATLLVKAHATRHAILLSHFGCGYYKDRFPYESPEAMERRQLADLRAAGKWMKGTHIQVETLLYYVRPVGGHVRFEPVT